jgi:checkpoint serine/threonine-protein kinase
VERPANAWEFHILSELHRRLLTGSAARLFIVPKGFSLYRDESYLLLPLLPGQTLLDVVNLSRSDESFLGMEEIIATFFAIDVLRIVDAMHQAGIVHGDLKPDNLILRVNETSRLSGTVYSGSEDNPWCQLGLQCIDFGKAVDMRLCSITDQFYLSTKDGLSRSDTVLDKRLLFPWQWDIDFVGVVGIIHVLLFGKYWCPDLPEGKWDDNVVFEMVQKWPWKRYWQRAIWMDLLKVLLKSDQTFTLRWFRMRECRTRLERWLSEQSEAKMRILVTLATTSSYR